MYKRTAIASVWLIFAAWCWATCAVGQVSQSLATVLVAEDYAQTVWNLDHGGDEGNPLLGLHPSRGRLTAYNALVIASEWVMPKAIRLPWNWLTIGVELYAVGVNAGVQVSGGEHIGLRVRRAR